MWTFTTGGADRRRCSRAKHRASRDRPQARPACPAAPAAVWRPLQGCRGWGSASADSRPAGGVPSQWRRPPYGGRFRGCRGWGSASADSRPAGEVRASRVAPAAVGGRFRGCRGWGSASADSRPAGQVDSQRARSPSVVAPAAVRRPLQGLSRLGIRFCGFPTCGVITASPRRPRRGRRSSSRGPNAQGWLASCARGRRRTRGAPARPSQLR